MKKLLAVILSVIMVFSFAACAGKSANNEGESQTEETTTIRIGAMAGPTAMGMVKLRKDSENGNTKNTYAFEDFATDASAFVTPQLIYIIRRKARSRLLLLIHLEFLIL